MAKQSCAMPVVIRGSIVRMGVIDMLQAFALIDHWVNRNQQLIASLVSLFGRGLPTI